MLADCLLLLKAVEVNGLLCVLEGQREGVSIGKVVLQLGVALQKADDLEADEVGRIKVEEFGLLVRN